MVFFKVKQVDIFGKKTIENLSPITSVANRDVFPEPPLPGANVPRAMRDREYCG